MLDFLIIGGGIAGVSTAARLSELGSVALVEAEDSLAHHASGRSAAMYLKSYGNEIVCALNAASEDYLMTCAGGAGVLSPRGVLTLANQEQFADLDQVCKADDTEEIDMAQAMELCPIIDRNVIKRAALTEDARDLDTDLYLQDFARVARANGGRIFTGAKVTGLSKSAAGWTIEISSGPRSDAPEILTAKMVVNASGAWADVTAGMAGIAPIGFTPYRRSVARMPAPGGHDVRSWPMMLGAVEDWYAKPDAGKWIVSAAEEDPQEPHDVFADDMVIAEGIARYEEMVTEPVTRVETTWAGLRTFAPDRALVLGPDPIDHSFIWCAGQGGYGFQTAAAASLTVAASITGNGNGPLEPAQMAALSPKRFGARN